MKTAIVAALVCVNLALVGALVFHVSAPPAQAQVSGGASDYVMVTVRYSSAQEALFVLDLNTRVLAAWEWDRASKGLVPLLPARPLIPDFRGPGR